MFASRLLYVKNENVWPHPLNFHSIAGSCVHLSVDSRTAWNLGKLIWSAKYGSGHIKCSSGDLDLNKLNWAND